MNDCGLGKREYPQRNVDLFNLINFINKMKTNLLYQHIMKLVLWQALLLEILGLSLVILFTVLVFLFFN